MNKIIGKHKLLCLVIALFVALALVPAAPAAVKADSAADYIKLTRHDSYNNDGQFYMSFTTEALYMGFDVGARVVNSAGKQVFSWKPRHCEFQESMKTNFGADYRSLPTGKYTFILTCTLDPTRSWSWSYTINHKRNESFNLKSCQKVNMNGKLVYKWDVQCTNLKGQKLTMKIFDSKGQLVYNLTGPARKSASEVGFFTWSGYSTEGNKRKCPPGTYLVQVTVPGSQKVVEKEYKLNLN